MISKRGAPISIPISATPNMTAASPWSAGGTERIMSARLPRIVSRVSCRKPVMIERIRISAPTPTKMPLMPIQLVRRARM